MGTLFTMCAILFKWCSLQCVQRGQIIERLVRQVGLARGKLNILGRAASQRNLYLTTKVQKVTKMKRMRNRQTNVDLATGGVDILTRAAA